MLGAYMPFLYLGVCIFVCHMHACKRMSVFVSACMDVHMYLAQDEVVGVAVIQGEKLPTV